jgi:hypothetical protein
MPRRQVDVIGGAIIIAGTGTVGLGQRFTAAAQDLYESNGFKGKNHLEWAKTLCSAGIKDFAETQAPKGSYGALVAFRTKKGEHLCEFPAEDFQPELKEDKCWYVSMGSGQSLADPYLALMRLTFWKNGAPSLVDGVFAAAWVMKHAIEVAHGLIGPPIRIATLTKDSARLLSDDELEEHLNLVDESLRHFASFAERLTKSAGTPELPAGPRSGT